MTGALGGSQIVRDGVAGVSGLDGVRDVVVSPNGDFVYAVSATDDAAVAFARNASGQLTFVNAEIDGVGGANGLDGAFAIAISPDGKNVYVASDVDDAVAIFGVVARTGELSPGGFLQDGVGGVNGLAIAQSVVVSPRRQARLRRRPRRRRDRGLHARSVPRHAPVPDRRDGRRASTA